MTEASLNERIYDALRAAGKKALADEFSDAFPEPIRPYVNAWGDDPNLYSEEFCRECGNVLPSHYTNCTPEGRVRADAAVTTA